MAEEPLYCTMKLEQSSKRQTSTIWFAESLGAKRLKWDESLRRSGVTNLRLVAKNKFSSTNYCVCTQYSVL